MFIRPTKHLSRGFTLLELLIVIGIFIIITSLLVANYNRFGGNLLVSNLAYDIALSIREAQAYGIAVKGYQNPDTGSGGFTFGYGINVDGTSLPATSYVLFTDLKPNTLYDADENELLKTYSLQKGNVIANICATRATNGNLDCATDNTGNATRQLTITFLRPNPEATIRAKTLTTCGCRERICIRSPQGKMKSIYIQTSGQIAVFDGSRCP